MTFLSSCMNLQVRGLAGVRERGQVLTFGRELRDWPVVAGLPTG